MKPVGIFYFSHTAVHLPAITLLGIKEDLEHLKHSNYEYMSRREFMTSLIDPFSANLVAAFYKYVPIKVEYFNNIKFNNNIVCFHDESSFLDILSLKII